MTILLGAETLGQ